LIIVEIQKQSGGRSLENFITPVLRKFARNKRHRHIRLRGEVAYSKSHVYLIFPLGALELAFALSIYFKCEKHRVPCHLHLTRNIELDKIPREILEAAQAWSEKKLPRKYYVLRSMEIQLPQ